MTRLAHQQESVQSPSITPALSDIDTDLRRFATRLIAARYRLAPHVAALVAALAGLGGRQ